MDDQSVNVSGSGNRVIAHSIGSDQFVASRNSETARLMNILLTGVQREEGALTIGCNAKSGWVVGLVFGQEAEDSDMAGGVSYGMGVSLAECLRMVVEETGWDR